MLLVPPGAGVAAGGGGEGLHHRAGAADDAGEGLVEARGVRQGAVVEDGAGVVAPADLAVAVGREGGDRTADGKGSGVDRRAAGVIHGGREPQVATVHGDLPIAGQAVRDGEIHVVADLRAAEAVAVAAGRDRAGDGEGRGAGLVPGGKAGVREQREIEGVRAARVVRDDREDVGGGDHLSEDRVVQVAAPEHQDRVGAHGNAPDAGPAANSGDAHGIESEGGPGTHGGGAAIGRCRGAGQVDGRRTGDRHRIARSGQGAPHGEDQRVVVGGGGNIGKVIAGSRDGEVAGDQNATRAGLGDRVGDRHRRADGDAVVGGGEGIGDERSRRQRQLVGGGAGDHVGVGAEGHAADGDRGLEGDGSHGAGEESGVIGGVVPRDMGRSAGVPVEERGVPVAAGSTTGPVAIGEDVGRPAVPVEVGGTGGMDDGKAATGHQESAEREL